MSLKPEGPPAASNASAPHPTAAAGERLANRVLGMVHGAKSQFGVAFEAMEVVGRSCGGKVEAVYTPNGFLSPGAGTGGLGGVGSGWGLH